MARAGATSSARLSIRHIAARSIAMSKIHIEGLHKTYASSHGRVTALKEVNLSIKQNEFVTLVGPSGCGKSTLLKLIGALIRPSRGTLLFDGVPLLRPTRDVGIVFKTPYSWSGARYSTTSCCPPKSSDSTGSNRAIAPWTLSNSSV